NADRILNDPSAPGISTNATNKSVTLQPVSAAWAIDLGSTTDAAANTLELSDAELDKITTGTLRIGSPGNAGSITVSAPITAGSYAILSLRTGGGILDGTGTEQPDLSVTNLAVQSAAGIGDADNLDVAVFNLAFKNTGGAVVISNAGALKIG